MVSDIIPKLNPETKVRYGTDWRQIKFVCAYIDFTAAALMGEDTQVTEALLNSTMYEVDMKRLGWGFATMRKFLNGAYLKGEQGEDLYRKRERAERVLRFIAEAEELIRSG